jgi:hypothetical protein
MTTYPSHFSQSLGNHGAMAYLKASPTYHMNGLSALGMSHGLDSLNSQSLHHYGGMQKIPLKRILDAQFKSSAVTQPFVASAGTEPTFLIIYNWRRICNNFCEFFLLQGRNKGERGRLFPDNNSTYWNPSLAKPDTLTFSCGRKSH